MKVVEKIKMIVWLITMVLCFAPALLFSQDTKSHNILVTGNTLGTINNKELLKKWQEKLDKTQNTSIILTGRISDIKKKKYSIELYDELKSTLMIAPGKEEWAGGTKAGKEAIKDIDNTVRELTDAKVIFPDDACPGPEEVVINKHLVVILLDTYWWLHPHDRRFNKCDIDTREDILINIEDIIRKHYQSKHILIVGHHSLKSYGNSGGYFSTFQSIFMAPYVLFRKVPGSRKDNQHPDFKDFRDAMLNILKKYPHLLYVSAGDKNLQYFVENNNHFIVSGAFEESKYVNKKLPEYGSEKNGFTKISFMPDGKCSLSFIGDSGTLFSKAIYDKSFAKKKPSQSFTFNFQDTLTTNASRKYSGASRFWLGTNYREVWEEPITAPVFNIRERGLTIVKRGGGQQTFSLRLEDLNGRQYVLRSVDKDVSGALPREVLNTFAADLVQDQISASNPYASLVVAELAEHAGIFHTNPEIVYVPDDPNLGIYRQDVAGGLFLFEERPDDDRSDVQSFGRSKNIISTNDVIENTTRHQDHLIDTKSLLRARLFDIIINDWDRHDDQWRWASFEEKGKTIYKPIPRDRDQAFFVNEGVLPWIAARKWLIPKIQGFDTITKNMSGQSFNARFFDRSFLVNASWNDWKEQIDTLQALLSPSVVSKAVQEFPAGIQDICADRTVETLNARIRNLEPMARNLYLLLSKEVDISGTKKDDVFELKLQKDTGLLVMQYIQKNNSQEKDTLYKRLFKPDETKTIRLYGLQGNDKYKITGRGKSKIKIRLIGGEDKDSVLYAGQKAPGKLRIYDKENTFVSHRLKKRHISNYDADVLEYDRNKFQYDVVYPGLLLAYNPDDGLLLGGGPVITSFSRYQSNNYKLLANYSFRSDAVNILFSGQNTFHLKRRELNYKLQYKSPSYIDNFFGLGNDTEWEVEKSERNYYRVRMRRYKAEVSLLKWFDKSKFHKAGPGLAYSNTEITNTDSVFVTDIPLNGLQWADLKTHEYLQASLGYSFNTMEDKELKNEEVFAGSNIFTTKGFRMKVAYKYYFGLNKRSDEFSKISTSWVYYLSFAQRPRVVYAFRMGGEKLFGKYVFYEAANLGREDYLRGFAKNRFHGDASLYFNAEMRIRMKHFKTYAFNGTLGLLIFNDLGRVWYEGENSNTIHNGYGFGFWLSPFDMAVLNLSLEHSREENFLIFSLNYQF